MVRKSKAKPSKTKRETWVDRKQRIVERQSGRFVHITFVAKRKPAKKKIPRDVSEPRKIRRFRVLKRTPPPPPPQPERKTERVPTPEIQEPERETRRKSEPKHYGGKGKPIEFDKMGFVYMCKVWIVGRKKPVFITMNKSPMSSRLLDAPPGSRNRRAIYAKVREIVEESDKKVRHIRLKETINMRTGHRVQW